MYDVVVVISDLFFMSRIASSAQAAQRTVQFLSSMSAVRAVQGFSLALVDLDADLDVPNAVLFLKGLGTGPIIAFGPHVDTDGRKAAREAGADRVLARSKFATELPNLLARSTSDKP